MPPYKIVIIDYAGFVAEDYRNTYDSAQQTYERLVKDPEVISVVVLAIVPGDQYRVLWESHRSV